jgi:GNAT superfamily N-acetyltransferase
VGGVTIRDLTSPDLPHVAALVRRLLPTMVVSERGLDHMRKSTRWWVVENGTSIVGAARAGRFGRCWVGVAPEARGQGLGGELLEVVERTLRSAGHAEAVAWTDDEQGVRFAGSHGYTEERRKPVSVLHLAEQEPPPLEVPAGVELVPIVELDDRLRELYELTMSAYRDDPADSRDAQQTFEEWLRDDIGVPDLDFQGSVVAVVDGRLAALALVTTDGSERAENELTGTHPDFRGRGLATLVKLSTVHWARARGIREIWTANDSENSPMLAVNRKLGYRPAHERRKVVKGL